MSEDLPPAGNGPEGSPPGDESAPHLRARVPDHVAGGTFSTGAIVITGPSEFVLDFLQTIGRPHRVAARVIIPHVVMPQFIEALRTNLDLYQQRFGTPPVPPQGQGEGKRPTPQEIYDDLKMPDEVLSGVYANGVMIGHGPSEFGLDFLTSFFPQSAVSARVFLAAGQVPRLLDSLRNAVMQLQQRRSQGGDLSLPPGASGSPGADPVDPTRPHSPEDPEDGPANDDDDSEGPDGSDAGGSGKGDGGPWV